MFVLYKGYATDAFREKSLPLLFCLSFFFVVLFPSFLVIPTHSLVNSQVWPGLKRAHQRLGRFQKLPSRVKLHMVSLQDAGSNPVVGRVAKQSTAENEPTDG